MDAILSFMSVHPLIVLVLCMAGMLALRLLCAPLPPDEPHDDGMPEDWPWRKREPKDIVE